MIKKKVSCKMKVKALFQRDILETNKNYFIIIMYIIIKYKCKTLKYNVKYNYVIIYDIIIILFLMIVILAL